MSELNGQMRMTGAELEDMTGTAEGVAALGQALGAGMTAADAEDARRLDVLAGQINILESQAKDVFRRTAIEIGQRLIEARGLVRGGCWEEWLRANVDYSLRKAQQLMQVAEAYAGKAMPEAYDRLSFTQIYDLLAAPAEERDALAQAAADEDWSTRELKRQIDEANERYKAAQQSIFELHQQAEIAEAAIRREREAAEQYKADAEAAAESAGRLRDEADRERQRAKDAVNRASNADDKRRTAEADAAAVRAELAKAAEEMDALKRRPPEIVEVTPKAVTEQLEAAERRRGELDAEVTRLRAEVEAARSGAMQADERKGMMLASVVRIGLKDARAKLEEAVKALGMLRGIDADKAEMLAGEARNLADWARGQLD